MQLSRLRFTMMQWYSAATMLEAGLQSLQMHGTAYGIWTASKCNRGILIRDL
jgi:hypothetical protein